MMRLALSMMAISALPVAAQDLSNSTGVLTHFANRCAQIGADPAAAQAASPGSSTVTASDGSMVIHYEATGQFGNLVFRRLTFPNGTNTDCSLLLNGFTPGIYDDMGTLIAQNGAALFGTEVVSYGDPTPQGAVQMIVTPGYPPAALLTHAQGPDYVELSLSLRTTPAPAQPSPAAPEPAKPEPQPAPVLQAAPDAQELAQMGEIGAGITACVDAATAPEQLAPALQRAGFSFTRVVGASDMVFASDAAPGVEARLSPSGRTAYCALTARGLLFDFAVQAVAAATGTPASATPGCPDQTITSGPAPIRLTVTNPDTSACSDPIGATVSLALQ